MNSSKPEYYRHRFPSEIISRCMWLYFRFSLSYRDVEEMMAERGVAVSYETIRDWTIKFGDLYAKRLKSKAKRPGDCWHLDEVFLTINGTRQYLWRAVDQDGEVLDILVQLRRNKHVAKKFFHRLLKKLKYVPRLIVTDKLGSYTAVKREIMPTVKHVRDKGANNRAKNSPAHTQARTTYARIQNRWTCSTILINL